MIDINLSKYANAGKNIKNKKLGRVTQVVGLTIESIGPDVSINDLCHIKASVNSIPVLAEVVGFKNNNILLMPLGSMDGIGPGSMVESTNMPLKIKVSEELLGRVVNSLGEPIDGLGDISAFDEISVKNKPPNPLTRKRVKEVATIGISAIDGLLTLGKGQRVGIFSGSGVGKSTLLGMIARNAKSDINVIALIGERGREIREFIEKDLGEEGLKKSILVIATSDEPALSRLKAAEVATSIGEYFREKGKDVLLLMDSLTRFSMAQREIGLAVGEPPVSRGYTPSVFATMPKLLERAGMSEKGSITGIYTVLVDGDDLSEPITDTARGILDGHIILNRKIASKNQYPAIDVLASVSRVMGDVVTEEHKNKADKIKDLMATYNEAEDLINIGAYTVGGNKKIDLAIEKHDQIIDFLKQKTEVKIDYEETLSRISAILSE